MKRAICLIALMPVLASAGCGGGGDDSTPTTIPAATTETPKQLSKDQFISQGDGFCGEVNAALDGLGSGDSDQAASLYKGLLEHLRGLGTPDDDSGLDEFYSAGEDLVSAEEGNGDVATAESAFSSAASSYGFQECGSGSAPSTSASGATGVAPPTATTPVVPAPTTTVPAAPVTPAPAPGATGAGGGTAGTGGGSTGTGGTTGGSGGVGPG